MGSIPFRHELVIIPRARGQNRVTCGGVLKKMKKGRGKKNHFIPKEGIKRRHKGYF